MTTLIETHPLDSAVALQSIGEGRYTGTVSPLYWNMVGPFGGVTASTLLKAVLEHPGLKGRPLAETVNFCSAITTEPFSIDVVLERDGKSTQHWRVSLVQDGKVGANATIVTGAHRDTWGHQATTVPAMPAADTIAPSSMTNRNGWPARYEMRFVSGAPSLAAEGEEPTAGVTKAWLRDEPPRPLDYLALAALADAFAPRVMLMRNARAPAATVSLSTYFLADEAELGAQGMRPVIGLAALRAAKHGFHDQTVELWGDNGSILAVSHQMVWFKD